MLDFPCYVSNYHVAIPWFPQQEIDVTGTHPILWPEASAPTSPRALLEWNLPRRPLCAVCASFKTPRGMSSNVNNDGPGQQVLPCRNGQVPLVEVSFMVVSKIATESSLHLTNATLQPWQRQHQPSVSVNILFFSLLELQNKCGKFQIWLDMYIYIYIYIQCFPWLWIPWHFFQSESRKQLLK